MNNYLKLILKLFGTGLFIFLLSKKIEWQQFLIVFKEFELFYILFMLVVMGFGFFVTYSSLVVLLRTQNSFSFFRYFWNYLLSLAIGTLSPARVGDFSLAFFIKTS